MDKKLEKDFLAAQLLNNRLAIASTCFELEMIPKAKFICCHEDLFSILVAKQLKDHLKRQGHDVRICVSERFEGLVKDNPNAKDWVRFSGKLHDLSIDPKETIFVSTKAVAREKLSSEYQNSYFAILERFRDTEIPLGTFIESKDAQHGIRRVKNVDFIICYDDDITSALYATLLFWHLYDRFGPYGPSGEVRKIVCVGGRGLMSKFLYRSLMKGEQRKTEGKLLKKVCMRQQVPEEVIVVCDNGNNTGANLNEIEAVIGNKTAIVAVTQRLSMILYMSQQQQKPDLELDYFVIFESVKDTCKYMNGMRFCNCKPILHFWAHVYRRWRIYSRGKEIFMTPVFGVDEDIEKSAELLQDKYFAKQQGFEVRGLWQMIPFLVDLLFNGKKAVKEYEAEMERWNKNVLRTYAESMFTYKNY